MAHRSLVPKNRTLTEQETQISFEAWREAMIFSISLSDKSARFLSTGNLCAWTAAEDRGFTDDGEIGESSPGVTAENKMNKAAKGALLNIVLGSIAGYAPVISSRFIKYQSTSLEAIWNRLRAFYGFRRTGSRVLEMMDIKMQLNESRESLWERYYSFVEDQLLVRGDSVTHEGVVITENEEFTPTLLNILVTCWLHTINPALPGLIRQRFTTQLRSCTLYTIREEVSDAIPSILEELADKECSISRTGTFQRGKSRGRGFTQSRTSSSNQSFSNRSCCLCIAAGRASSNHFLSACPFLPTEDKKFMTKTREISVQQIEDLTDDDEDQEAISTKALLINPISTPSCSFSRIEDTAEREIPNVRKIDVFASPTIEVSVDSKVSSWTLDSGAEANVIRIDECNRLGLTIEPTTRRATQGDGKTPLPTYGEVHFTASRGHHKLVFSGLVVKDLDTAVLAGMPFHRMNRIKIDYSDCFIVLEDCCNIKFDTNKKLRARSSVCALRVRNQTCILPGEEIQLELPDSLRTKDFVAVEPRTTVPKNMPEWIGCHIVVPNATGNIVLTNSTNEPVLLSKHTQVAQVRATTEGYPSQAQHHVAVNRETRPTPVSLNKPCSIIDLESKVLSREDREKFKQIHEEFSPVFEPGIGCYNGYSGKFTHTINMGPNLPPQRRGRVPDYSKNDKDLLQEKFDMLEAEGVLSRAEDVEQPVEFVHPSFLVKKASGGHRLVTSFGEVAEHARPQPTANSNVEHALHQIGQYDVILVADIKDAYYHVPLSQDSCKYVGVVTPYKGTFVYRRSVMGLPGSESALEELLNRIFGDLVKAGKMVKVADDLFLGSTSVDGLADTWREVLKRLHLNGLRLSPHKTRICPSTATILGWEWSHGSIRPGAHRLNALSHCEVPNTVKSLRSYIGAYKYLSRVLPCYAEVLKPLEDMCAGKESSEKIIWSEDLTAAFEKSKAHLKKVKPVALPKRTEELNIVTDAAITPIGIAATLLILRNNKLTLAGYFSAVLKNNQVKLLPCEAEALAIGISIKHFSYFITQSLHPTRILTDSRACVLAYRKLQRGEFSTSPRVTTFLSIASRYAVEIMHIKGTSNVFSDFASRHPVKCEADNCAVCEFVSETCNASVGEITVSDVLSGKTKIPYTTKSSWLKIQQLCPDLQRVRKYLNHRGRYCQEEEKANRCQKIHELWCVSSLRKFSRPT